MKIVALTENTAGNPELESEHGLSLYIEACGHKLLFDMGQTEVFARNAEKLHIPLAAVDLAVLSHGHYDHSGGLRRFLQLNDRAPVYLSQFAFEPHYHGTRYIGLDPGLAGDRRLRFVGDSLRLDEGLELFSCNDRPRPYSAACFGLNMLTDGQLAPDDFRHEQYLLIREGEKRVLISGCSHKGIFNILSWFSPDVLVGGFHFMLLDPAGAGEPVLKDAAARLLSFPTEYYTCHCTGAAQFDFLQPRVGARLHYFSCGQQLEL